MCLPLRLARGTGTRISSPSRSYRPPASPKKAPRMATTSSDAATARPASSLLRKNDRRKVAVTSVTASGRFYVLLDTDDAFAVSGLPKRIFASIEAASSTTPAPPTKGDVCAAFYAETKEWYRARVVDARPADDRFDVFFVDYGNAETVRARDVRPLDERLRRDIGFQAVQCALIDYEPRRDRLADFRAALQDKEFDVLVYDVRNLGDDVVVVDVKLSDDALVKELIRRGVLQRKPKEGSLSPGATYDDAYVSSVVNPGNFWIQFDADRLTSMSNDVQRLGKTDMIGDVFPGLYCCAKYSLDSAWYRARVLSVKESKADVIFIDFGNTETVSIGEIRSMKEILYDTPALASKCSLTDIETFTSNSKSVFESLILDIPLRCKCIRIHDDDEAEVALVAPGGIDVADALVDKKVATPRKQAGYQGDITAELELNKVYPLLIAYTENPLSFWCQLAANSSRIETLSSELEAYYGTGKGKPASICRARPCVAQFSDDGAWYRARIESTQPLRVRYVDYGNAEVVPNPERCVREIEAKFLALPAQAFRCSLSGDDSLKSKTKEFEKLVTGNDVTGKILRKSPGKVVTDLVVGGGSVAAALAGGEINDPNLPKDDYTTVEVVAMTKDWFWCRIVDPNSNDEVTQLGEQLSRYCRSPDAVALPMPPRVGATCAAQFSEDDEWYRARVESILLNQRFRVRFLDFGNSEATTGDKLKSLPSDFCRLPAQSIKCRLAQFPDGFLDDADMKKFEEIVLDKEVHAALVTRSSDGVHLLTLIDTSTSTDVDIGKEVSRRRLVTEIADAPISVGATVRVFVVTANSTNEIWCQVTDESFAGLMTDIADCYASSSALAETKLDRVANGTICCAKFSADDSWYRAEVIGSESDGGVNVRYVDFGNTEVVRRENVRALKRRFAEKPRSAFCAELAGAKESKNVNLNELVRNKDMTCTVTAMSGKKPAVILVDLTTGKSLVDELESIRRKNAPPSQPPQPPSQPPQPPSQPPQPPQPPQQPAPSMTPAYKVNPFKIGDVISITITYVESSGDFWIQRSSKNVAQLQEHVQLFYKKLTDPRANITAPEVDTPVCAKSAADDTWYRGIIVGASGNEAEIFYVDYGNKETLPLNRLRKLHKDYKALPACVLHCRLAGLSTGAWTDSDAEAFDAIAADYNYEFKAECKAYVRERNQYAVDLTTVVGNVNFKAEWERRRKSASGPSTRREVPVRTTAATSTENLKISMATPTWKADATELICVVGVLRVNHMWCQFVRSTESLRALSDAIARHCETTLTSLPLASLKEGAFCLSRYADGCFYRARIRSVDRSTNKVTVHYVDFGNTQETNADELRPITPDFCRLPATAFVCKLSGVEPIDGKEWSKEASAYLERITIGKKLYARRVTSFGTGIAVELIDSSSGSSVSIAAELTKEKHAKIARRSDGSSTTGVAPAYVLSGQNHDVMVTYVESPTRFFCKFSRDDRDFGRVVAEMRRQCDGGCPFPNPRPGNGCCARYSADGKWYRAEIRAIESDGTAEVQFIDYGNVDVVPVSDLREMSAGVREARAQCLEATLDVAKPIFTPDEIDKFADAVLDQKFSCRVMYRDGEGKVTVQLLDMESGKNIADWLGIKPSSAPSRAAPGVASARLSYRRLDYAVDTRLRVAVTACDADGEFWAQAVTAADEIETLMEEVRDVYSQLDARQESLTGDVGVGCPCCATFSVDGAWYRAEVIAVLGDGVVTVRFIDYGNVEDVAVATLKALRPRFIRVPAQAALFHVIDATPLGEDFRAAVVDQEIDVVLKKVRRAGEFDVAVDVATESSPTPLKDVDVNVGSSVEVCVAVAANDPGDVWLQLTSKLDDLEKLATEMNDTESPALSSFRVGELCCAKYSVDGSWYRAVVIDVKGTDVEIRFVDFGNREIVAATDIRLLEERFRHFSPQAFRCVVIAGAECLVYGEHVLCKVVSKKEAGFEVELSKAIEHASLPKSGTFRAYVTHVARPGEVFVQVLSRDVDELNLLMEEMAEKYTALAESDSAMQSAQIGSVCCAQYSEDRSWYRGEITNVTDAGASVLFIDYGNEEFVDWSKVKELTGGKATTLPAQAIRCQLIGEWNSDYFDSIVNDQEAVTFRVVDDGKIELHPTFDPTAVAVGDTTKVYLSYLEHPDSFYCQPVATADDLVSLMRDLGSYVDDAAPLATPVVGASCCAQYPDDGGWYRAEVIGLVGRDDVTVRYVDYGNSETVSARLVRCLDARFFSLPAQAIRCCLADVVSSTEDGAWSEAAEAAFEEATTDRTLKIEVAAKHPGNVYVVRVFDVDAGINVGDKLVAEGGAIPEKAKLEEHKSEEGK